MHDLSMHDTQTIEIEADPARVQTFIADGANLPRWAIGFAKDVQPSGEQWIVTTGSGDRIPTDIVTNPVTGTVDFVMAPAPGSPPPRGLGSLLLTAARCSRSRKCRPLRCLTTCSPPRCGRCRTSSWRSRRCSRSSVRCERCRSRGAGPSR